MTAPSFDQDLAELLSDATEAQPRAEVARAKPRRRYQQVLWLGAGFISGALFWHLVGFWSFVSDVAFNSDETASQPAGRSASALVRRNAPAKTQDITTGSLPDKETSNQQGCVAAARAETGSIVLVGCKEPPPATKSVLAAPKEDLTTVEPSQSPPAIAAPPVIPQPVNTSPPQTEAPAESPDTWAAGVDINISAEPVAEDIAPFTRQRIVVEPPAERR